MVPDLRQLGDAYDFYLCFDLSPSACCLPLSCWCQVVLQVIRCDWY